MLELNVYTICIMILIPMSMMSTSAGSTASEIRSYPILEGENLLVICNVTESPDLDVYWTKNQTGNHFIQQGKRLEILNIHREYSGNYICHALNTSFPVQDYNETDVNKTVQVVNVDVQYPGEINGFFIEPVELVENQTFTVFCGFHANPNPVWSIFNRDNGYGMMAATGQANVTLVSPKVTCDYSGYWECTGKNMLNYGVNVTRGQNVTVYCTPKPMFGKNQYQLYGKVGEPVQLNMYAKANPHGIYTWSKDDGTDISNATIHDDDLDQTNLTFPMFSVPYFGNYTLKMENRLGTNYAHYQILADGEPETPTRLRISDVTSDSVTLQWTSGFDMGSRQYFIIMKLSGNQYIRFSSYIYDNSTNHGINQNWTYVLNKLTSDTNYNLTVISENDRGFRSGLAEPSVAFKTKRCPHKTDVKLILGLTFGSIGTLGMLAFIVYVVKFKRLKTSYDTMKEGVY